MTATYMTGSADCIDVPEARSRDLLRAWLSAAGYDAEPFPLARDDAAALLAIGGQYDVTPDELTRLAKMGVVPDLAAYDGRDVLAAAAALEGRRAWQFPSVHTPKMHHTARILAEARAEGPEAVADLQSAMRPMDVGFMLTLLAECDNRELREQLVTSARLALEVNHGVVV